MDMIHYFEEQLRELDRSIHSMDEGMFRKMVETAVGTIKAGHKIIVRSGEKCSHL